MTLDTEIEFQARTTAFGEPAQCRIVTRTSIMPEHSAKSVVDADLGR